MAKALLNVQRQLQPIPKDAENSFTKSRYTSLKSVMAVCRDALLDNGIWLCQYPVPVDTPGCLGLVTKLTHAESGQWQSSLAVVPMPKADPQGMGSAITYARRYALTTMLSMVTEDDDGEGAKSGQKSEPRVKRAANRHQTLKAQNRNISKAVIMLTLQKTWQRSLKNCRNWRESHTKS
ncbi:ERF family protein [uncultured Desulfovibrio sp.]|uniref:ERF family protein n=1 Tax=uncultured Desulfovibrio sp. TaxID=167968 RepID=UPI002616970B|nr:ERF family protein [uncultured Desulfovibrio sp.]